MGNSACALNLETDTTKVISANFVKYEMFLQSVFTGTDQTKNKTKGK